jgi:hypothetical protein
MWIDVVLVLVILLSLLSWSGAHLQRTRDPLPLIREEPRGINLLEFRAEPTDRPHQSPAA